MGRRADFCGSGLAHESGGSVCIDVGWAAAIAGKPCSHRGLGWVQGLYPPQMLCGSGLARESGGSACIDVGWAAVIAGKPCSHRGLGWVLGLCLPQMLCGSGLARESGGSVCIDVGWAAVIAGKPCSHRGSGVGDKACRYWCCTCTIELTCTLACICSAPPPRRMPRTGQASR